MARQAMIDHSNRKVKIKTVDLVKQLKKNLDSHTKKHQEALEGYKEAFEEAIGKAFAKAKDYIVKSEAKITEKLDGLDVNDPGRWDGRHLVLESTIIDLPFPRNYEKEYLAAIDLFEWEVSETVELSFSEFNVLVRDNWEWKHDFEVVAKSYSKSFE